MRLLLSCLFAIGFFTVLGQKSELNGAWLTMNGNETTLVLIQDGYYTSTTFTAESFISTHGGVYRIEGRNFILTEEFHSGQEKLSVQTMAFDVNPSRLLLKDSEYKNVDTGEAPLAGVWKISHVMRDGELQEIQHTGTRKTLKLLTGTKFQWFAIDPAENKFYGTGGGTYTFVEGKYVEHIEFFSRDDSRVGAALEFKDKVENNKWTHTGLSSKGDPIYEVWEKTK